MIIISKKMCDSICWVGEHVYLAVTGSEPMAEGHCILVTKEHYANLPSCDEDVAREMLNLRRMLTGYFKAKNNTEPVFITTGLFIKT
jgi:diadenosine tetraphosphate (Ap4A) HIT family hydrolase